MTKRVLSQVQKEDMAFLEELTEPSCKKKCKALKIVKSPRTTYFSYESNVQQ